MPDCTGAGSEIFVSGRDLGRGIAAGAGSVAIAQRVLQCHVDPV